MAKLSHERNVIIMQSTELNEYQDYFDAVLGKALARFEERVGKVIDVPVKINCIDDSDFWALATPLSTRLQLDVPWGALARIGSLEYFPCAIREVVR